MKLETLFDFQRFEHNTKLDQMIRETENRYGTELSDDDLSFVSAAGLPVDSRELIKKMEDKKKPIN